MIIITLYPPGEPTKVYETEEWGVRDNGVLAFRVANKDERVTTTVPFLAVEQVARKATAPPEPDESESPGKPGVWS